ncbi:MAG: histidinol dehydrogenase [bacterium]|nr:histidinol dehydrogenase [bacterium]
MKILSLPKDRNEIDSYLKKPFLDKEIGVVSEIISSVQSKGDEAIIQYTEMFDGIRLNSLRVPKDEIKDSLSHIDKKDLALIERACENIRDFQSQTLSSSWTKELNGKVVGEEAMPIERVGLYIPGGNFPLISTLLMTVIPAQVAGVQEIAISSPPSINSYILGTCGLLGITEVYQMGGAQAIAGLAYGTESIKRVDMIAGPGNIYVTLAKRQVYGDVGIDLLAGPSEVVVIADAKAEPYSVANELLAQAEHGKGYLAILIADSLKLAEEVKELTKELMDGLVILVEDMGSGIGLVNEIAPEHLVIYTENPMKVKKKIKNAGAIFLSTPVAIGDYIAGPSHTLPTGGSARFSSGLSANTFQKKTSIISYTKDSLIRESEPLIRIAELEGLVRHKKSVEDKVVKKS